MYRKINNMKFLKNKSRIIIFLLLLSSFIWMATDGKRLYKIAKSMEIFAEAYKIVNNDFVDETDPNLLMRIAIDSMLGGIDPYTNYFSESQISKAKINFRGLGDGVGFEVTEHNGKIVVSDIVAESAAKAAGVIVGDELIEIDGAKIKDKNVEDIQQSLQGKEGTQVVVKLKRYGSNEFKELNLTRGKISKENVPFFEMLDDKTAYIVLTTFTDRAGENVANALKELQKKHKPKQVILDLRENGGGLLIEAVNICNVFLPKSQEIVYTKNKVADWDKNFGTLNNPIDTEIPLIVLINEHSASASEIVAGAIQDYDRGLLVGRRSFGKGLVQNVYDISYNSKVKLTTARYYIPSGRCIQALEYKDGKGVKISDEVKQTFKTKAGRIVNDGGGLRPDFEVQSDKISAMVNSMIENKVFFDFANQYRALHDSISNAEKFKLGEKDFSDFNKFLENGNYNLVTAAEKELENAVKKAKEEGIYDNLKNKFDQMKAKIEVSKKQDLISSKNKIIEILEEEIVSRYYFEKGKIQLRLKRDKDVQEAITLFADQNRFKKLLSVQQ
jgi:carboxyl-terminal processing protease